MPISTATGAAARVGRLRRQQANQLRLRRVQRHHGQRGPPADARDRSGLAGRGGAAATRDRWARLSTRPCLGGGAEGRVGRQRFELANHGAGLEQVDQTLTRQGGAEIRRQADRGGAGRPDRPPGRPRRGTIAGAGRRSPCRRGGRPHPTLPHPRGEGREGGPPPRRILIQRRHRNELHRGAVISSSVLRQWQRADGPKAPSNSRPDRKPARAGRLRCGVFSTAVRPRLRGRQVLLDPLFGPLARPAGGAVEFQRTGVPGGAAVAGGAASPIRSHTPSARSTATECGDAPSETSRASRPRSSCQRKPPPRACTGNSPSSRKMKPLAS